MQPASTPRVDDPHPATIPCRLCGATSAFAFSRTGDDGVGIGCFKCTNCGSLETEPPYWIDALYASSSGASNQGLDTFAVERCEMARIAIALLWKLGGFTHRNDKMLDWGGGPGLLVRMMRDVGVNAFLYDKYSPNHYAVGFTRTAGEHYSFMTAFEVFEHFANPSVDLEPLFAMQPRFLLISTCLYESQGADWAYLGAPKSEHVFFYSRKALRWIGERYGYQVCELPRETTLFYKPPVSTLRLRLARALLKKDYIAHLAFALKKKWSLGADDYTTIERQLQSRSTG